MEPSQLAIIVSGAVEVLKWAVPEIQKRTQDGEISTADQAALLAKIAELRDKTSAEYAGPENEPSGR